MGHPKTEGVGGSRLDVVSLVDDQIIVLRQNTVTGSHISQQKGMVDDDQVGALGGHPHTIEGAGSAGALHTGFSSATIIGSREARPDFAFDRPIQVDFAQVAGGASLQPDEYFRQHAHFFRTFGAAAAQRFQTPRT